jgi:hypothetical protein
MVDHFIVISNIKNKYYCVDNAIDKVNNLKGVYLDWIDTTRFNNKHQLGMIAQEVEKITPELVDTSPDGIKSVNYSQMTALLIEAIKEQNNTINQLKIDIDMLKNKKRVKKQKEPKE